MKRGPYEITSKKDIYKNSWIQVHEDLVIRPDGEKGIFGIVEYSSGVSIVALNKQNEIFLIKEYVYAIDEYNISLPQGGIELNETPINAAKRELQEETGLISDKWTELGYINPYTMIIKGPIHLFLAQNVQQISVHEPEIEIFTVPFTTAVQWVMESKINHSGSCMAILKARDFV